MEWATRKWVRSYSTVTYILCFGLVIAVPLLVLLGALLLQMVSAERHDLQQRVMLVQDPGRWCPRNRQGGVCGLP